MSENEVKVAETAAPKAETQKKADVVVESKPAAVVAPAAAATAAPAVSPEMAKVVHDPNAPVVSVKSLLATGAHFGHMTRNWSPKFKPFIYTARSGIHIINLDITAQKIAEDYKILKDIVAKGGKVLFVGTKKAASDIIAEEAVRSGSFYCNHRWLGGTLTNFKVISNRAKLLKSLEQLEIDGIYDTMPKKQAIEDKKTQAKLAITLEGIKEMRKTPEAVVVVDPKHEHNAVHEAMMLHIPVFALIGSNADPASVTYPIPCNDDSSKTIRLIVGILADAVVDGKGGDVSYAFVKEDGDTAKFNDMLKGVDRMEEFKLIKMKIREDQYLMRAAKKAGKRGNKGFHKKPFGKKPFIKHDDHGDNTHAAPVAQTAPVTGGEKPAEEAPAAANKE
jgi:small subunit ribosomal protein S2